MLDPTIPPEGMTGKTYLATSSGRNGSRPSTTRSLAAGKEVGVPYDFDDHPHAQHARCAPADPLGAMRSSKQHEMAERLFMAYWSEGQDVGDRDVLDRCGRSPSGSTRTQIREAARTATQDRRRSRRPKSSTPPRSASPGFPPSSSARAMRVVGAQSPEVLADAISAAWRADLS